MKKLWVYTILLLFFNWVYASQVITKKDGNGNFSHIEKRPAHFAHELLSYNIGKNCFFDALFPTYVEQFEQKNPWNKEEIEQWLKIAYVHFDPDNLQNAPLSLENIIQGRVVFNNQEKIPNNFIERVVTFGFLTLQRDMNASNVLFRMQGKELLPVLVDLEESFRYTEAKGIGFPCLIEDRATNSELYNDDFNSAPPSQDIKNLINSINAEKVNAMIDRYALPLTREQRDRDKAQWFCALEYQCGKYKHLEFLKPLSDQLRELMLQMNDGENKEEQYNNALQNLEVKITFFNRLEALKLAFDKTDSFLGVMKNLFMIKPYTKEGILNEGEDAFGNNNFDSDLFSFLKVEQDLIIGKSFIKQSKKLSNKRKSNEKFVLVAVLLSIVGIALGILCKKIYAKGSFNLKMVSVFLTKIRQLGQ